MVDQIPARVDDFVPEAVCGVGADLCMKNVAIILCRQYRLDRTRPSHTTPHHTTPHHTT